MKDDENICGQRIDYENPVYERLSEKEAKVYDESSREVENLLAIITQIQSERTNEDGEITEPLTSTQRNTLLEIGVPLERSLTRLKTLEEDL